MKNASIIDALVELLGKPTTEASALVIPTASYAHPMSGPAGAWRTITGRSPAPLCNQEWKSMGILELTALPSLSRDLWVPLVEEADALLVGGGDSLYLAHWIRESGLIDVLPSLHDTVWVGLS